MNIALCFRFASTQPGALEHDPLSLKPFLFLIDIKQVSYVLAMILISAESMEEVRGGEGVMSKFRPQTAAPQNGGCCKALGIIYIENVNVLSDIDNSLSNYC